jgi:ribonuclease HI
MKLTIHLDGGSRGNPGPAGAGVVIHDDKNKSIYEAAFFLGPMTNNMAEYTGLLRALDAAARLRGSDLHIFSDSELLVRQVNGDYRVKDEKLKPLWEQAQAKLKAIHSWKVEHVRREGNQRADELANTAMDAGEDVIVIDGSQARRRKKSAATGGTSPTAQSDAVVIVATCTHGVDAAECPAPCKEGDTFVFDKIVPPGICLGIAGRLLESLEVIRRTRKEQIAACPTAGCGAVFELSVKK